MAGGMGFGPQTPFPGHATGYMGPQNLPPFNNGLGFGGGAPTPGWGPGPIPYPNTPGFGIMPGAYPPAYPPFTPAGPPQNQSRPGGDRPSEQGADLDIQSKWLAGPNCMLLALFAFNIC
jgi:hypothetical protein